MTLLDGQPWRADFPFEARMAMVDGYRMHYVDEGEGEPLVFVHGNPTWSYYWRTLLAGLRSEYRVIACDHLGCGLSDKPQQYDYSLARHSENLKSLLDQLNVGRFTLVGHDWGGAIGLHCGLVSSPGRLERVVLLNTGAYPPHRIPLRIALCQVPLIGTWLIRGLNVFPRAALRMATVRHHLWTAAQRRAILAPYGNWANRVGIWRFVRDIPRHPSHPTYGQLQLLQARLADLRSVPVALIWGMQDWCFDDSCLQRMVQLLPHAELTALCSAGHWVVEDCPGEVLSAVTAFLHKTPPCRTRMASDASIAASSG